VISNVIIKSKDAFEKKTYLFDLKSSYSSINETRIVHFPEIVLVLVICNVASASLCFFQNVFYFFKCTTAYNVLDLSSNEYVIMETREAYNISNYIY